MHVGIVPPADVEGGDIHFSVAVLYAHRAPEIIVRRMPDDIRHESRTQSLFIQRAFHWEAGHELHPVDRLGIDRSEPPTQIHSTEKGNAQV